MKKQFKFNNIPVRRLLFALAFSAITLSWMGCETDYGYIPPPPDPNVEVSFKNDIFPIFNASCNDASCHLNGNESPDLTTDSIAYAELYNNSLIDTVMPENSELYIRMNSSTSPMPPSSSGGKLPADKIALVLTWIEQGGKNN